MAALWGRCEASSRGRPDYLSSLLSANWAAVGVGSFLFHAVATRWPKLADVRPIEFIVLLYFGATLVRAHRVIGHTIPERSGQSNGGERRSHSPMPKALPHEPHTPSTCPAAVVTPGPRRTYSVGDVQIDSCDFGKK